MSFKKAILRHQKRHGFLMAQKIYDTVGELNTFAKPTSFR